jgi:hypothetical protein
MAWGKFIEQLKDMAGLSGRKVAAVQDRKAVRVKHQFALIGLRANGETVSLRAIDCAATGLRVESPQALKKGEVLRLTLPAGAARPPMNENEVPRATIAWARKKRMLPTYILGLAFILDTPEQKKGVAHFLLDECKVIIGDPREHRRTPRTALRSRALLRTFGGEPVSVDVRDISTGGMLVLADRAFNIRSKLEVTVFLDGVAKPVEFRGEVLRCAQVLPGTVEVGVSISSIEEEHSARLVRYLSQVLSSAEE